MVDQEVVDILAEIKHQITSAQTTATAETTGAVHELPVSRNVPENIDRYSSLVVLARAWDRLPPVVSNRTGAAASLELWLKSKLRRALRWLTWEQVNFNAATYKTVQELVESSTSTNQRLSRIEQQLQATLTAITDELVGEFRIKNDRLWEHLTSLRDQLEKSRAEVARYQAESNSLRVLINEKQSQFEAAIDSLLDEHSARNEALTAAASEQASAQLQERLAQLVKEFRERDERLLDEQRVCFKQLSLELTESQVLQDRARRELDARVAKLESGKKV